MDEKDLLAAVIESPNDDQPRLEFAKWCDTYDSPRGEFIRAQCQAERLPLNDPNRMELSSRAFKLLQVHEKRWLEPIKPLTFFAHFHRGFPEIVGVLVDKFALVAEQLFSLTPVSTLSLCCIDIKDYLPQIISCPHLNRVNKLTLNRLNIDDEKVKLISESSYLNNLQNLELGENKITAKGIASLAQSKYLSNLNSLSLYSNQIGSNGAKNLAKTTQLTRLKSLNLNNASIGPAGVAALADSAGLAGLTTLIMGRFRFGNTVGGEAIGDDGAVAIASSKYLNKLEYLSLEEKIVQLVIEERWQSQSLPISVRLSN
jgi:uncharacterized protein (TIGR02996 family)